MSDITLYGSSLSLFTGRARSYLIKSGLAYRETLPVSEHYTERVLPKMGGRRSVPVIETEGGEVIRDGAAIIDHYEELNRTLFFSANSKTKSPQPAVRCYWYRGFVTSLQCTIDGISRRKISIF